MQSAHESALQFLRSGYLVVQAPEERLAIDRGLFKEYLSNIPEFNGLSLKY